MTPNPSKAIMCIGVCLLVLCFNPRGLSAVFAQNANLPSVRCDLPTCIQMALARHPDLQADEAKKLAAQAKVEFEKAQWRPQFDFRGETGTLNGKSTSPFAVLSGVTEEGFPQREVSGGYYAGSVTLSVPIVREGKIFGWNSPSIQEARFSLDSTESLQLTRRGQVGYQVTEAFINVLKVSEMVKEQEQVVKLTESQYLLAQERFRRNLVSRNDLLMAEVQLATANRDLTMARNAVARAQRGLAKAMGLEAPSTVDVRDPPPPPLRAKPLPAFEELLSFAYQHRPEIRAQQALIQAREAEVKRTRGERLPSLALVAEYSVASAFDPSIATQWRTVAQLTGPIFNFGRSAQKENLARALATEESKRLESLIGEIAGEVQEAHTRIIDTVAQLDLLDKHIEQATEALKLARAMFAQQLLPESSVAEAQKSLVKLEQAKVVTNYDLILAYSQLELVTGGWESKRP